MISITKNNTLSPAVNLVAKAKAKKVPINKNFFAEIFIKIPKTKKRRNSMHQIPRSNNKNCNLINRRKDNSKCQKIRINHRIIFFQGQLIGKVKYNYIQKIFQMSLIIKRRN